MQHLTEDHLLQVLLVVDIDTKVGDSPDSFSLDNDVLVFGSKDKARNEVMSNYSISILFTISGNVGNYPQGFLLVLLGTDS